ncbi:MAG: hypothetical protein ACD_79C01375G0006 [uncultured bacterium]|nr:MAG: hypothetical protein ACD_79C01375G0006 [uncultured bacterium]
MHFSQNQLLLYKLFLSYPEKSFYMQEIGRILKKKPGVFQRTLNNLEEDGFVKSEFKANARFFCLNRDYQILDEVKSIIKKMHDKLNVFSEAVKTEEQKNKKRSKPIKKKKEVKVKTSKLPSKISDLHEGEILTSLVPERSTESSHSIIPDSSSELNQKQNDEKDIADESFSKPDLNEPQKEQKKKETKSNFNEEVYNDLSALLPEEPDYTVNEKLTPLKSKFKKISKKEETYFDQLELF